MKSAARAVGICMLSTVALVAAVGQNTALAAPVSAAAETPLSAARVSTATTPAGFLTGTIRSRAGTQGAAARSAPSGGGRIQVAYHRLGSGEDTLKPYSATISRSGSFSLPVPSFGANERVIAMVTAWQGGQVLHSTGPLTPPRAAGGKAGVGGRSGLALTFTRNGAGASAADSANVKSVVSRDGRAIPKHELPEDCYWRKYPNTGDPYTQLVPLWRAHTAGNIFLDFTYKDESNTSIEVGFEVAATKKLKISGSYSVANSSSTESSMRINGNKDRWIYGTFLYTYWESGCYLAPSGYRTGDYRTATQEAWTGELVQSFSAGTHPKRDVTRCATQRAPYRVFVDRDSNNPWTRASSRTSSHGWKFSYLDGGLVGAVTTMESRQVTAKYSLSSGTAYICGKGAPPSSAGVIYTTGTS